MEHVMNSTLAGWIWDLTKEQHALFQMSPWYNLSPEQQRDFAIQMEHAAYVAQIGFRPTIGVYRNTIAKDTSTTTKHHTQDHERGT